MADDLDGLRDDGAPGPPSPVRWYRAFVVTLGVCVGASLLGAVLAFLDTSPEFGALKYLFAVPVVWVVALLTGLVWWGFDRERGPGIVLGALAGAILGFMLCSGVLAVGAQ